MFALKGMTETDFEVLRKHSNRRIATKNEVLIQTSDSADMFFLIEDGSAKLVQRKAKDHGDEDVIGAVKAGGFFGEEALLGEKQVYGITAVAMENTVLLTLNKEGLQKIMTESMGTGTRLLLALSRTYREALATPEKMARVITFYGTKGGAGCTTAAINTAHLLARHKKKVAFLDCDLQFGNANLHVGAPQNLNLGRLIQRESTLSFERIKLFLDHRFDLELMYSPELPQEAELVTRSNLNQILNALGREYDFIVLDSRCEIDDQTLLLWDMADALTIVTQADLAGVTRLHRLFRVMSRLNYPKGKFTILVNRYQEGQAEYLEQFRKLPIGLLQSVAADEEALSKALLAGEPVMEKWPASPFIRDLQSFTKHLLGESAQPPQKKGGIFSRLASIFSST